MDLKIYDDQLNYLGIIDSYSSCIITRKYKGVENLQMTIPLTFYTFKLLKKHYWIYAGKRRIFEILHREIDASKPRQLKITALGGGSLLNRRIILATVDGTYKAETLTCALVSSCLEPGVAADERAIGFLKVNEANLNGSMLTCPSRFTKLGDGVSDILGHDEFGYYFDFEFINDVPKLAFNIYKGTDRSISNTEDIPPAIFALKYDNVISQKYTESETDCKTVVYVGGQDEGIDRTIVTVGEKEGVERFETFADARDSNDNDTLIARGKTEQQFETKTFDAQINPNANLIYEQDYFLGDKISVQDEELDLTLDTRITEIKETYQSGQADTLELTFGESYPTFLSTIKAQRKQIEHLNIV